MGRSRGHAISAKPSQRRRNRRADQRGRPPPAAERVGRESSAEEGAGRTQSRAPISSLLPGGKPPRRQLASVILGRPEPPKPDHHQARLRCAEEKIKAVPGKSRSPNPGLERVLRDPRQEEADDRHQVTENAEFKGDLGQGKRKEPA